MRVTDSGILIGVCFLQSSERPLLLFVSVPGSSKSVRYILENAPETIDVTDPGMIITVNLLHSVNE